ncbi:MAG TPA: aminoglycoside phosphotransferase family protein [Aquaticitalea sp.]|nr:aminoglycoside phosphotransferase family protein [Aquaticitalea sp.]
MELKNTNIDQIKSTFSAYEPPSVDFKAELLASGHINRTFKILNNGKYYILQKINALVFKNPQVITQNILTVSQHLKSKSYPHPVLKLLPFSDGHYWLENQWRLFRFTGNSKTYEKVQSRKQAFEAAKFLGEFHFFLNNLDAHNIQDSIVGFLDFNSRTEQFENALESASEERLAQSKHEIKFIQDHRFILEEWNSLLPKIPTRVIHADPKISNFLFDEADENKVLALIDWDTIMAGTILYDFGDMVRSYTNLRKEDDPKNGNNFNKENYLALKDGFLVHLKNVLTDEEIFGLDLAAKTVVYIQAVRFLTDFLNNDVYYATQSPGQNLDRTKNQLNLLRAIIDNQ